MYLHPAQKYKKEINIRSSSPYPYFLFLKKKVYHRNAHISDVPGKPIL
jgi:hypothetical protein